MTNFPIYKLIAILSLKICGEALADHQGLLSSRRTEASEKCEQEIEALGDIGDPAAVFAGFDIMGGGGCAISMTGGVTVSCDLAEINNKTDCLNLGGSYHRLKFDYSCGTFALDVKNLPVCAGASCNIDNMLSGPGVKENMSTNIGEGLSSYPFVTVNDQCGVGEYAATKSTYPESTDPESTTPQSTKNNGSLHFSNTLMFVVLMIATPILITV